jgi:hypothetical protein
VDALGNFFKGSSVTVIEGAIFKDDERIEHKLSHQPMDDNLDHIPIFNKPHIPPAAENEIHSLQDLLRKCLSILHNNLQDCTQHLLKSSSSRPLTEG